VLAFLLLAACREHFDEHIDAPIVDVMPDQAGCPVTYTPSTGLTSLYRIVPGSTTWLQAEALCEADGTHLIVINQATENTFARSLNADVSEHVWLGGGDHLVEGTFGWINGEPFTYTRWGGTEPNNSMNIEDAMEIDDNGLWNDERNVGLMTYHTVCECDGLVAMTNRYCDTDSIASCGVCGNACSTPLMCVNQVCQ
jgi:hypothetical protein